MNKTIGAIDEIIVKLKKVSVDCADSRGRSGEYLDIQIDGVLDLAIELREEILNE